MFYLHVEIINYKQLKIIIPDKIEPLEKKIGQIISASGGEPHPSVQGLFSFHSTFRETSLALISAAFQIYKNLAALADKLYGFSLILSDSNWSDEEVESRIRNYIYRIPLQDSIWLLEDRKRNLETHIVTESARGLTKIVEQKEELPGTVERMRHFCRRDAHIDSIVETVEELGNPLGERALVYLNGNRFNGVDYNLDAVLEKLCPEDNVPLIFLNNCSSENPLDPFVWSINKEIEDKVSPYLDNGELDLWRSLSSAMDLFRNSWNAEQCSDFIEKDFFTLYSLYLKAYIKIRKDNNLLPLIICKNVDKWKSDSLKLLVDLFQTLISREGLIPLCTGDDIDWSDRMKQGKVKTIHFKPYSVEELRKRIANAFPDLTIEERELYSLYKNSDALAIPMFHSLLSRLESGRFFENHHSLKGVLEGFDELTLTLLYLIQIAGGLIRKEDYSDFFESRGYSESRISERFEHLYLFSLIEGSQYPRPVFKDLNSHVESALPVQKKDLVNSFTNYLFSLWEKGTHINIENLFRVMISYGQVGKSLQIYQVILDRFLNNKQFKLADHYLSMIFFDLKKLSVGEKDALKNIIFAGRMRSALLKEDYREVQNIISESEIIKVHKKSTYSSHTSLQHSLYMNSMGDYSRGLNLAKEALFEFQQSGDNAGEAKANIELATALLGQGKIRTSQDYFEISRRASFQSKDLLCQIRSSFFKSLSDFIFGNIPMALRGVNDILPVAERAGRREWQLMLIHLKGRILFDLGRYRDCEDIYKEAYEMAVYYGMDRAASLLRRWNARSLIYNERYRDGIDILKEMEYTDESLFFLAEAAYFGRREDKALEYLNNAGMKYRRIDFIPSETPLWKDGFSSVEGYSLSRDSESDVLMNQIQAFRYYLTGLNGDLNNAMAGFSELTGRYSNQGANHYYHKYFFLYSDILPDSVSDEENRLKILSNSVKLLQSRAGRFDDQKMKHSFLNYNVWNKRITEESVKRNFI
ncbi:hypothetical protein [Spirochaeta isovalerica]|uniref:Tetratricopeptide (TPR) repeat protein n=1 Tax=Spirochaeta isovalerica TaxID=150 RepID=A0A841R5S3_9SPIO|nr:hypothetical protein [Spirochaeta isovalerica]MBB6478410.1 tetratricopeptide (TPR) repeat protein [Spirochaeta isovalerica]